MPINRDHPQIYELLGLIINEYEELAIKGQTREGIMSVMNAPLTGMDMVLDGAKDTLTRVLDTRVKPNSSADVDPVEVSVVDRPGEDPDADPAPEIPQVPQVSVSGGVQADADLIAMLDSTEDGLITKALQECLGCDLRLSFDWQLKPIDLLGPIADMIGQINAALDQLWNNLDPFKAAQGFCENMNDFSLICIPDWIAMLMALKMLLRRYMTFSLNLKLDWTVILGPLLKLIIEAITSLINEIAGVIVAPLDCAISALEVIEKLGREAKDLALHADAFADHLVDRNQELSEGNILGEDPIDFMSKDVTWDVDEDAEAFDLGQLTTTQRQAGATKRKDAFSFPSGFELSSKRGLPDSLKDPEFLQTPFVTKLRVSVEDAKEYIMELVRKLNYSLRSINSLVGGGLSLQLGSLGLLLFIKDIIALLMVIIRMIQSHSVQPDDWCQYFQDNPQVLDAEFRPLLGIGVEAEGTDTLVFTRGPDTHVVRTCSNENSSVDSNLLSQWVADLNSGSGS